MSALALLCAAAVAHGAGMADQKGMMGGMSGDMKTVLQGYEMKVCQAFKDKDSAAFLSYVDPNGWSADAMGFTPVSQVPSMMKDYEVTSFSIDDFKVQMIDADAYVATYVWKGTGSYKGEAFPAVPVYCSTVWSKKGDDWKAVYHQETFAMAAMSPAGGSH
jgi:hypothetical protein